VSPKVGMTPVRRAEIVRATIRCLGRDGYTRLTMKRVAREAGVSQGILHYYFEDKRDILTAALRAVAGDLNRRVAVAQARGPRDAWSRLGAVVRACLDVALEDRQVWVVFIEFWGEMLHDDRLRAINAEVYAGARGALARLVSDGMRGGVFRAVRPAEAAAVILALVDGLSLQLTFEPAAMRAGRAAHLVEETLRRYLAP
jgi:AcrR family transcriptional regulator